jgi:hypothetical protein
MEPQKKSCTLHLQITSASAQRLEVCDPERLLGFKVHAPFITASHKSSKELVKLSPNQVDYSASPKSPGLEHHTHLLPPLLPHHQLLTSTHPPSRSSSDSARPFLLLVFCSISPDSFSGTMYNAAPPWRSATGSTFASKLLPSRPASALLGTGL